MDNEIKITIGIPIYNSEKHLEYAVKSVLKQTYNNFELILSDDGSTDDSLKIALSFSDPRITVLYDGLNRGLAYRLNEQIKIAKGKYFARMDADDIMLPDRLINQLRLLELNSKLDLIGASAYIINNENDILGVRESNDPKNLTKLLEGGGFVIHPTVMAKTEWFKRNEYDVTIRRCQDLELWIRTYEELNYAISKEKVIYYRVDLKNYRNKYFQAFVNLKIILKKHKGKFSQYLYYKLILTSFLKFFFYKTISLYKKFSAVLNFKDQSYTLEKKILNKILE